MNLKALTTALIIGLMSVGTAHADYDDRIEAQVYQDPNFNAIMDKAIKKVQAKGYEVGEADVDTRFGKPVIKVEAYKGYAEYEIVLSYPALNVISERPDY